MKESHFLQHNSTLFIQNSIYHHLHNTALQAALKGMEDVTTRKVVMQKSLKFLSGKLSARLMTQNVRSSVNSVK